MNLRQRKLSKLRHQPGRQCSAHVKAYYRPRSPCRNPAEAKYHHGGKDYCRTHYPPNVAKRAMETKQRRIEKARKHLEELLKHA
jgi:hypothetical protein